MELKHHAPKHYLADLLKMKMAVGRAYIKDEQIVTVSVMMANSSLSNPTAVRRIDAFSGGNISMPPCKESIIYPTHPR